MTESVQQRTECKAFCWRRQILTSTVLQGTLHTHLCCQHRFLHSTCQDCSQCKCLVRRLLRVHSTCRASSLCTCRSCKLQPLDSTVQQSKTRKYSFCPHHCHRSISLPRSEGKHAVWERPPEHSTILASNLGKCLCCSLQKLHSISRSHTLYIHLRYSLRPRGSTSHQHTGCSF